MCVSMGYLTPEQAIAATLGNHPTKSGRGYYTDRDDDGTHIMCDDCGGYIGTAEEIAATLGSGTCHIVKTWSDSDYNEDWRYRCSECGCNIPINERDPETGDVINAANYCPNCGSKVIG